MPATEPNHPVLEIPTGKILSLRGVRTHSLKNISLDLPLRRWITLIGVSGSGKTSLARDTILAEAHRRYLESLSLSTRQYLDRVDRPDVDRIDGLPPCLASGPQSLARGPRTTLATLLSLQDLLATLFARIGTTFCPQCGTIIRAETPHSAAERIASWSAGARLQIGFLARDESELQKAGYSRFVSLNTEGSNPKTLCILDRLVIPEEVTDEWKLRTAESIGIAFQQGEGRCETLLSLPPVNESSTLARIDDVDRHRISLMRDPICSSCGYETILAEPRLFQFRSPLGACPSCNGTGKLRPTNAQRRKSRQISNPEVCPSCSGTRLRAEARNVRIEGQSIVEVTSWDSLKIRLWLTSVRENLSAEHIKLVSRPLGELLRRFDLLEKLGLQDLPWSRGTATLSLGERERLSVATLLSHQMVHALYLLDEPTRGLHPLDRLKLIDALEDLRSAGNTLLVVEHDPLFLKHADWIVELGPGSGEQGGNILYSGASAAFPQERRAILEQPPAESSRHRSPTGTLRLLRTDAEAVEFPLGLLCVVTGVSGSGKSRLITADLSDAVGKHLTGDTSSIEIDGEIDELICMDERPAPLSSQSTPATLLHVWSAIRSLFAATDEARRRNFDMKTFGLSTGSAGRCPACAGRGALLIDLQFLPDTQVVCPQCRGTRYRPDLLEVTYRGLTIAEVLELGIQSALTHFRGENQILRKLTSAVALGLESLRLGQPAASLSAGELQRLKLAQHLGKRSGKRTLFLIDEPTAGLHPQDVSRLVKSLDQLVGAGHSVIVIDHHPQLLRQADEILDLGTTGGKLQGSVIARGRFAEVSANPQSATGKFLNLRKKP